MSEDHLMMALSPVALKTPDARWTGSGRSSGRGPGLAGVLVRVIEGLILEKNETTLPTGRRLARELAELRPGVHAGYACSSFVDDVPTRRVRGRDDVGITAILDKNTADSYDDPARR